MTVPDKNGGCGAMASLTSHEPATGALLWSGESGDVDGEVSRARHAWAAWAAKPLAVRIETSSVGGMVTPTINETAVSGGCRSILWLAFLALSTTGTANVYMVSASPALKLLYRWLSSVMGRTARMQVSSSGLAWRRRLSS